MLRRATTTAAAVLLASGLLSVGAGPALAADIPVDFSDETGSELTTDYGEYWSFYVQFGSFAWSPGEYVARDGEGDEVARGPAYSGGGANVGAELFDHPLDVGEYEFTVALRDGYPSDAPFDSGSTDVPATLVIEPAALGVDLRVETDPNQPSNAILSARMSGDFLQRPTDFGDANAVLPAGTWHVVVLDEEGNAAFDQSVDQVTDGDPFASFYWSDVPRGTEFRATATFTPSEQQGNFAFTPSVETVYTSSAADEGTSVGPHTSQVSVPQPVPGLAVPLWGAIAAGVVGALLLIAQVLLVLVVLRRRRRARRDAEPANTEPRPAEHEEELQDA